MVIAVTEFSMMAETTGLRREQGAETRTGALCHPAWPDQSATERPRGENGA